MEKKSTGGNGRFLAGFVITVIAVLVINALFVVYTDPFYQYHAPLGRLPILLEEPVYQTAGAARNLEYTDAIVGTSMTENMHTSWFDEEMGWNTIKLSYSGAKTDDLKEIMGQIFAGDRKVNHIVMDLNEYQLTSPKDQPYVERPEYLYDTKIWNDRDYLLNFSVTVRGYKVLLAGWKGSGDNTDTAYTWEEENLFGKEITLRSARRDKQNILNATHETRTREDWIEGCQENLDNILPFIREHTDTEFIIFYPPYSVLYWEQKVLSGELEDILAIYKYSIQTLLQYPNVRFFYFHDEKDIIENIDNYRDVCHHHPKCNRFIFECIRDGKKELTIGGTEERSRDLHTYLRDLDYSLYWEE